MQKTLIVLGTLLSLAAALGGMGCSGNVCSYSKQCQNDPMPTQDQIKLAEDQCNTVVNQYRDAPCFGAANNYLSCLKSNYVCDSSGKTDANLSSAKRTVNCDASKKDVAACCVKNPGSKGC
jgi:hypothetical protein